MKNIRKNEIIEQELSKFELNQGCKSYFILKDVIILLSTDKYAVKDPFRHSVYLKISRRYKTNERTLESELQKVIDKIKFRCDTDFLKSYFNISNINELTLKSFILRLSENCLKIIKTPKIDKIS